MRGPAETNEFAGFLPCSSKGTFPAANDTDAGRAREFWWTLPRVGVR
jgi:hypothetical protein